MTVISDSELSKNCQNTTFKSFPCHLAKSLGGIHLLRDQHCNYPEQLLVLTYLLYPKSSSVPVMSADVDVGHSSLPHFNDSSHNYMALVTTNWGHSTSYLV